MRVRNQLRSSNIAMTHCIPPLPKDNISEQAEYWLALWESPFFDESQAERFEQWLAFSAEHRLAWNKVQSFWLKLDAISPSQLARLEQEFTPSRPKSSFNAFSLPSFFNGFVPVFACLLLVCGLLAFHLGYFADFRTQTGEQRLIQLSDGSTVFLNTDTALSVNFSAERRELTLHHGQAYFQVAPDTLRPFEVLSSKGRVRALGTAFDVKQVADEMMVTVYEHSVSVQFTQGTTIDRLQAGQCLTLKAEQVMPIETVNLKQARAWQSKRLIFKDSPLQQVITELNRYRSGKIVITDASLAKHHVTGVFDVNDPEAALTAIEKTLGVTETRLTNQLVFLQKI